MGQFYCSQMWKKKSIIIFGTPKKRLIIRVYKSSRGKSHSRVKDKIKRRKVIKSPFIIPMVEHEAFQKESLFKETNLDYCFYKRPTFDLNMVMQVKKEREIGLTTMELEKLLKHQVNLISGPCSCGIAEERVLLCQFLSRLYWDGEAQGFQSGNLAVDFN